MNRFSDKTVLVTGASSGIGLACARAFADEGARVVITGRDKISLERARSALGPNAIAVRNDVVDIVAAGTLASELSKRKIRLDAVFINAGITKFASLIESTEALWDATFDTNVKGAYFQIQALLPLLNNGAAVLLNGSINAHIGAPGSSIYAASKAALISLAKTLSAELLPKGIRVNVISPGPIETPLYEKLGMDAETKGKTIAHIRSLIPLGRFGTSEEVAATVLHLTASESAFIIGTEVIIDGGMSQL
jgi:NAD(P)-dependent dehydrogenase (short-subunit alcohol dehydrogenase family)